MKVSVLGGLTAKICRSPTKAVQHPVGEWAYQEHMPLQYQKGLGAPVAKTWCSGRVAVISEASSLLPYIASVAYSFAITIGKLKV